MLLQTCLGLAAALGCAAWGVVTAKPSAQCLVSRQYLCQAALLGVGQYTTRYAVVARVLEPRCGSRGKVVWSREREREREKETERMEDRVTEERSAVSRSLLWFERDDVTHRSALNGEYRAFNENRGNFGGT